MSLFLRVFQHLLPNARAWRTTIDGQLREFFEGLADTGVDIKEFFDLVFSDIDPQQTRELTAWESQFGLPDTGLTTQERRDRLEAAWAETGGQSPYYLQTALRASGFEVYVHEWWEPGTEQTVDVSGAPGTVRNPFDYIAGDTVPGTDCGESLMACGEEQAECGNSEVLPGTDCGEDFMACGETAAECGNTAVKPGYLLVNKGVRVYTISADSTTWPYYLYIGGEVYGTFASVPGTRRDEFEALCLKLCPCQLWLGILVQYT